MQLKKCGGCARAIVESAAVCQYCGHATDSFAPEPASRPQGLEEDPFAFLDEALPTLPALTDSSLDDETPAAEAVPGSVETHTPQSEQSPAQATPIYAHADAVSDFELNDDADVNAVPGIEAKAPVHHQAVADIRVSAPVAPLKPSAPDANRDTEQRPQIVAMDDDLSSFDELWDTDAPAPATVVADEPPQAAVASASPVAAAAAAATPPKRGQAKMVAMGLAAGVVLIIAALGVRGTASPTVAATPVPAPAKKPAKNPAATPAPSAVVTAQPGAAASNVPVAVASGQAWSRVTDGRWVGRERRSVALELNANQKVAIWMRQVRPVLVVRCLANSADVFVFTQTAAKMEPQDENHTVQVGLDGAQPSTERWADSEEHDALFAPNGNAFVQQLMQSTALRFGFTPHNASPVVAEFNLSGLAELLAPSARQCGFAPAAKATRKH